MKFKCLTLLACIISTSIIMHNHTFYNNQKYEVLDLFTLSYGEQQTLWIEGDCVLLKDGKSLVKTTNQEKGKEITLTQKGVYKLIELK